MKHGNMTCFSFRNGDFPQKRPMTGSMEGGNMEIQPNLLEKSTNKQSWLEQWNAHIETIGFKPALPDKLKVQRYLPRKKHRCSHTWIGKRRVEGLKFFSSAAWDIYQWIGLMGTSSPETAWFLPTTTGFSCKLSHHLCLGIYQSLLNRNAPETCFLQRAAMVDVSRNGHSQPGPCHGDAEKCIWYAPKNGTKPVRISW